jgi:ABC-2 type transport system permease protein
MHVEKLPLPTDQQNDATACAPMRAPAHGDAPPEREDLPVSAWRAAVSLAWREMLRFVRQRNRLVGAVGQPLLFWFLFGAGMNQMFQVPGQPFREYFIPGTLVLILLFTAIFATISVIEDRQEGFLQSVLVAPVPRWALVWGKVLGGSILAVGQAILFLLLAITLGIQLTPGTAALSVTLMSLIAVGLTSLGFVLAWRLDSTQGFHAIMNLLLMPMWLLSGAFFPVPQSGSGSSWSEQGLHWVMRCNPVTYAVAGLRQLLVPARVAGTDELSPPLWLPGTGVSWLVTTVFAVTMFYAAARIARRPATGDLR